MEGLLISIIIPVFNGAKTIANAIDSFLVSKAPTDKYEIIVVDDGSTDDTLAFLYSKYKDVKNLIILSKQNGGPSSARNLGIKKSEGKYLLFVDADDHVNSTTFENLFSTSIPSHGLILDMKKETRDGVDKNSKFKKLETINKLTFYDALRKMPKVLDSSCNVLYSKKVLLENNLFFKENTYCEDLLFNVFYFKFANEISYFPGDYYFYSMDNNINSRSKAINSIGLSSAILNYFDICESYINSNDDYSKVCMANISKYFPILLGYLGHTERDYFDKIKPLLIKFNKHFRVCSIRTFICKLLLIFGFKFASLALKNRIK